jgi:[ribosomal protein S5]-alanine N-acetyltransferase
MEVKVLRNNLDSPIIRTERLSLRLFEDKDLEDAYKLFNDPEVQKYLSPKNRRTREQLKVSLKKFANHWNERGFGILCVTKKESGEMLGYCGFQFFDETDDVEILFCIILEDWNKGFATEAAKGCIKYGFKHLKFNRIYAATDPQNLASQSVLTKLGMHYDEESSHYEMKLAVFSLTREVFQSFQNY